MREGFNICIDSLPFSINIKYVNLAEEGIISKLRFNPHLIVLLPNKEDSDIILPAKIKMFIKDVPLLIILPKIPDSYLSFLRKIGVEKIIQLPVDNEEIKNAITSLLSCV